MKFNKTIIIVFVLTAIVFIISLFSYIGAILFGVMNIGLTVLFSSKDKTQKRFKDNPSVIIGDRRAERRI